MAKPENEREEIARIIDHRLADSAWIDSFGELPGLGDETCFEYVRRIALAEADAILARQTGEQDQGSSGGLGRSGSGSRDEPAVDATAALATRLKLCADRMNLVLSGSWDEEQDCDWEAKTGNQRLDRLDDLLGDLFDIARAPASTTPDTGTEKVAAQVEGEGSREAPTSRSQTGEPEPVALHDLADVFERPFTDPDDPRLQCARVLTHAEAEAILECRGDLVAALSVPAEAQARVEEWTYPEPERTTAVIAEAYAYLSTVRSVDGVMPEPALLVQRLQSRLERIDKSIKRAALLSPSTPKLARVEWLDYTESQVMEWLADKSRRYMGPNNRFGHALTALTAALHPTAPAKAGSE